MSIRNSMNDDTNIRRRFSLAPDNNALTANDHDKTHASEMPLMVSTDKHRQPRIPHTGDTLTQSPVRDCENTQDSLSARHESNRQWRFLTMRFRNASDSQLSLRARQQAENPPPVPRRTSTPYDIPCSHRSLLTHQHTAPTIVKTAPTNDIIAPKKMASRMSLAMKFYRSSETIPKDNNQTTYSQSLSSVNDRSRSPVAIRYEPKLTSLLAWNPNANSLNMLLNRQSVSSKSDASSAERTFYPSQTPTVKKSQSSIPFFKLRRGKKPPDQMFPLSHLPHQDTSQSSPVSLKSLGATTPRPSSVRSASTLRDYVNRSKDRSTPLATACDALGRGTPSSNSSPTRTNLLRGRSSTISSVGRNSTDDHLLNPKLRTSKSNRKTFGDFFGRIRTRQAPDLVRQGSLTPATPGSINSQNNSLHLSRGSVVLPERCNDETPAKFLTRLEEIVSRGAVASILCQGSDTFSAAVLRSYMRRFSFFGDPMDMALRKLLMEAELPKETQQIDRCLQAFANRYYECNPGIFSSPDQAYFIAFSLLILHTDTFNKNNKHKMQKSDYLKNTRGEGIFDEVLECFYDNISYTPFIHVEDDLDTSQDHSSHNKSKQKQIHATNSGDATKRALKEPIDPYTLIIDGNLDALRPNLKEAMHLDDPYSYLGTVTSFNLKDLQNTFFKTGVLQIVSARSRPDAFMSERTATNPEVAHPGIVDIKITKVGLLWRKETNKRKTRSPWQEWGAILTGAQLYFFRNISWIRTLMHQYENHIKAGHDGIPLIFKPPLAEFKPDALMPTQGAVALVDTTYKKHKNAFVYVRQEGLDEVLLADNEDERNDWLAKLNYAAAFRTSGVRMRGVIGANYDGQGRCGIRRLCNSDSPQLVQTSAGQASIVRGQVDHQITLDIQAARRNGMQQKIAEADRKVGDAQRLLDEQLRNARHLQILAPVQPRTREQLLLAAARMAAQMKWTRMEIWKERCHRDILVQDLVDERPVSASSAVTRLQPDTAVPSPPLDSQFDSIFPWHNQVEKSHQTHANIGTSRNPNPAEVSQDVELPTKQTPVTPPQTGTGLRRQSKGPSNPASDSENNWDKSPRSLSPSPAQSSVSMQPTRESLSQYSRGSASLKSAHSHENIDLDEHDFMSLTGFWESNLRRGSTEKAIISTSAESTINNNSADIGRVEKRKIRRSLQRTLRESAGHLSHHRSRKGKETSSGVEDDAGDVLPRGTGSFVVHGKKASVINLDPELQSISQYENVLLRKQKQQQQADESINSPILSGVQDQDSWYRRRSESQGHGDRRQSATSGGTATAQSFQELHRKYSTAQAARSASVGEKIPAPAGDEGEAGLSFSIDRRRSIPVIGGTSDAEAEDLDHASSVEHSGLDQARCQEPSDGHCNKTEELSTPDHDCLSSRPVEFVNA